MPSICWRSHATAETSYGAPETIFWRQAIKSLNNTTNLCEVTAHSMQLYILVAESNEFGFGRFLVSDDMFRPERDLVTIAQV